MRCLRRRVNCNPWLRDQAAVIGVDLTVRGAMSVAAIEALLSMCSTVPADGEHPASRCLFMTSTCWRRACIFHTVESTTALSSTVMKRGAQPWWQPEAHLPERQGQPVRAASQPGRGRPRATGGAASMRWPPACAPASPAPQTPVISMHRASESPVGPRGDLL